MKLYDEIRNAKGEHRTVFVLGEREIELIDGIINKAVQYFPKISNPEDYNRLKNIRSAFGKYLKNKKGGITFI